MYYVQCKYCGANNDPGERCDCQKENVRTKFKSGMTGKQPLPKTEYLLKITPSVIGRINETAR